MSPGRPGWTPHLVDGVGERDVDRWVPSACVLCSNGCGVDIAVSQGRMVGVRGRESDRVNHGRLGPKGLFGWQGQLRDRLERPLVRRDGRLVEAGWDEAMDLVVRRSRELLDSKGPLSHALLHQRPADARGVLHAGRDRQGRHRHARTWTATPGCAPPPPPQP